MDLLKNRPVLLTCIIIVIVVPSIIGIFNLKIQQSSNDGILRFTIEIEHFGVDPKEIERTITIPLEDKIAELRGTSFIESSSETNRSRVQVEVAQGISYNSYYVLLREAVDRLYSELPRSVQKPRIFSGASDSRPIFVASFSAEIKAPSEVRKFVEEVLKPDLQKITGVGEIEIGGGDQEEVHIRLDATRLAQYHLSSSQIANVVQSNNEIFPLGVFTQEIQSTPSIFDGHLEALDDFGGIRIPTANKQSVALDQIATINMGNKDQDNLSRIDGKPQVVVYIKDSGLGSVVAASDEIRKIIELKTAGILSYKIITDFGSDVQESFFNILKIISVSMIAIFIFMLLGMRNLSAALLVSLSLPLHAIICIGWPCLFGFQPSLSFLSGIGLAIGSASDTAIIIVFILFQGIKSKDLVNKFDSTKSAVIASTTTLVVVTLPILLSSSLSAHIHDTTMSYVLIIMESTLVNILILPVLVNMVTKNTVQNIKPPVLSRRLFNLIKFPYTHKKWTGLVFLLILIGSSIIFFIVPREKSALYRESYLFVHAEFLPGTHAEFIDVSLNKIRDQLATISGVSQIETQARRENGSFNIQFDPNRITEIDLRNKIDEYNDYYKDIFLLPEQTESGQSLEIQVSFIGPETATLKEICQGFAKLVAEDANVRQVVFHFKDGAVAHVFKINHDQLVLANTNTRSISDYLRWAVEGPVGLKWLHDDSEIDVRVFGNNTVVKNLSDVRLLRIPLSESVSVALNSLGTFEDSLEAAQTIQRINRQRGLSLTVQFNTKNIEFATSYLKTKITEMQLPSKYTFKIDQQIVDTLEQYKSLTLLVLLAIILIVTVLCIQYESFTTPVLVITSIVPSFFLALLGMLVLKINMNSNIFVSIIIVTGIVVNNAILITENFMQLKLHKPNSNIEPLIMRSIVQRIGPLTLTIGASVCASVPFLVFSDYRTVFLNQLSYIILLGSIGSFFISVFTYPVVLYYLNNFVRRYNPKYLTNVHKIEGSKDEKVNSVSNVSTI